MQPRRGRRRLTAAFRTRTRLHTALTALRLACLLPPRLRYLACPCCGPAASRCARRHRIAPPADHEPWPTPRLVWSFYLHTLPDLANTWPAPGLIQRQR
jgi:hypothetical protein